MPWLDGTDYTGGESLSDTLSISRNAVTAKKEFLVSGPPLAGNIEGALFLVAHCADVPKIGDYYNPTSTAGSPVCDSVEIAEISNSDNTVFRLYSVTCNYSLSIQTNSLDMFQWLGTAYGNTLTKELVYVEQQQENAHIDSSKTFVKYGLGDSAPLIGNDENGNINGVDIVDFSSVLVVEKYFLLSAINLQSISDALAHTNSLSFYDYDVGQCLFVGYQELGRTAVYDVGGGTPGQVVKMQFRFHVGKNLDQFSLPTFYDVDGDQILITGGKKAWEYLWTKNVTITDGTKVTVATDKVQVHDVYDEGAPVDFATVLGVSGVA